jgi:hypothetical protein
VVVVEEERWFWWVVFVVVVVVVVGTKRRGDMFLAFWGLKIGGLCLGGCKEGKSST